MLEIGPNLANVLLAGIPSLGVVASAVAFYLHARATRAITETASRNSERIKQIEKFINGGVAPPAGKD